MSNVITTVLSWHVKNNRVADVDCYWLLDALLEYTTLARVPPPVLERKTTMTALAKKLELPERMEGTQLSCYHLRPGPSLFVFIYLLQAAPSPRVNMGVCVQLFRCISL